MSEPTSMAEVLSTQKASKTNQFGPNYLVNVEAGRLVAANGDYIATTPEGCYAPKTKEDQDQLDYHYNNGLLIKA